MYLAVVALIIIGAVIALAAFYRGPRTVASTSGSKQQPSTLVGNDWLKGADLPTPRAEMAALVLGTDVDQPRNLAKSVTVE